MVEVVYELWDGPHLVDGCAVEGGGWRVKVGELGKVYGTYFHSFFSVSSRGYLRDEGVMPCFSFFLFFFFFFLNYRFEAGWAGALQHRRRMPETLCEISASRSFRTADSSDCTIRSRSGCFHMVEGWDADDGCRKP